LWRLHGRGLAGELLGRGGIDGVRRDALVEGGHKRERLERGARLALSLVGEIERLLSVVVAATHRAHASGHVVEDGHGRVEAYPRGAAVGGLLGLVLKREVERRGDVEPAAECLAGAVLVDELLTEPR